MVYTEMETRTSPTSYHARLLAGFLLADGALCVWFRYLPMLLHGSSSGEVNQARNGRTVTKEVQLHLKLPQRFLAISRVYISFRISPLAR